MSEEKNKSTTPGTNNEVKKKKIYDEFDKEVQSKIKMSVGDTNINTEDVTYEGEFGQQALDKAKREEEEAEKLKKIEEIQLEIGQDTVQKKKGKKLFKVGIGLIILAMIGTMTFNFLKSHQVVEDDTGVEDTETGDETNNQVVDTTPEIDYQAEINKIVEEIVGKPDCLVTDADELWNLYLLKTKMGIHAVYESTTGNKLDALCIIADANTEFLKSSIALVRSGFIGGDADNTSISVSGFAYGKVKNYSIIAYGDNAEKYESQAEAKVKELIGDDEPVEVSTNEEVQELNLPVEK